MALMIEKSIAVFDTNQIKCGFLIWGKHQTWNEGRAGFVTAVTEECLTVQYYPGISNVTNHFSIPVSEAANGQWEIRWSADMAEVHEYGIKEDDREETEEMEGVDDDDTGRIDL